MSGASGALGEPFFAGSACRGERKTASSRGTASTRERFMADLLRSGPAYLAAYGTSHPESSGVIGLPYSSTTAMRKHLHRPVLYVLAVLSVLVLFSLPAQAHELGKVQVYTTFLKNGDRKSVV